MLTLQSARDYLIGEELEFKNYRPGAKAFSEVDENEAAPAAAQKKPRQKSTQTRKKKEVPLPKKPTTLHQYILITFYLILFFSNLYPCSATKTFNSLKHQGLVPIRTTSSQPQEHQRHLEKRL
jgi:hypothetical protein